MLETSIRCRRHIHSHTFNMCLPSACMSLLLHSSRFPATRNHWLAAATCLAMDPTLLLDFVMCHPSRLPAAPRPNCPYDTTRPTLSDGRHARAIHENCCGNELFDRTSARRLWWCHNSAAHLPLSPHLVLKVLVGSLEIIHLLEQQLAQRVFVLLTRLRATDIAHTGVRTFTVVRCMGI
jgi:hypothetical protein